MAASGLSEAELYVRPSFMERLIADALRGRKAGASGTLSI
jgi:hypothetical protein